MNIFINNENTWKNHIDVELPDRILFKVDVYNSDDPQRLYIIKTYEFDIEKTGDINEDGNIVIREEDSEYYEQQFKLKIQEIKDGYNMG